MGFSPQTSIVHTDGKRGALLPILKSPEASTLDDRRGRAGPAADLPEPAAARR